MALSPWPSDPVAIAAAIATLRTDCIIESSATDEEINRIGQATAAMIEKEAAGAPDPIKTEAVIRLAAYIYWTTKSQGFVSDQLGPKTTVYSQHNHADMFRRSGAKGMLAPWRIRHAGMIG